MKRAFVRFCLTLTLIGIITSVMSPIIAAQTELPGGPYLGPFLDKIRFVCAGTPYEDYFLKYDRQTYMLMDDEVDIISGPAKAEELENLRAADNIEVVESYRYGYDITYFNCQKWPLNISAFRKAILLAIDKREMEEIWQGQGVAHDSCLPLAHPACIEDELDHYYDQDLSSAVDILDNLGFIDSDDDGLREGPGGVELDEFEIIYYQAPSAGPLLRDLSNVTAQALNALNFSTTLTRGYSFTYQILPRILAGNFDMISSSIAFRSLDLFRWTRFWSTQYIGYEDYNPSLWSNASWDALAEVIETSLDYDEIIDVAKEMQRIWHEECPAVIDCQRIYHTAYRTDEFEGFQHNLVIGAPSFLTALKVHEKNNQRWDQTGGTLLWAVPDDIYDAIPYLPILNGPSPWDIGWVTPYPIMELTQDSLVLIDNQMEDVPWLAKDWLIETHAENSDVPDGHMRITVDLVQNATWSDGTPITAADFVHTIMFHRENDKTHEYLEKFGYNFRENLYSCYWKIPTRFVVEFNTDSYWNWHSICYLSVLPKHQADLFDQLFTFDPSYSRFLCDLDTFSDVVVAGPFKPSEWVSTEYIEFTQNEYYWKNPRLLEPPTTPTTTTTSSTIPANSIVLGLVGGIISAAIVISVGGYLVIKKT